MINLLPQNRKTDLFLEQTKKLVIIFGGIAIICLLCFYLILLSIKFYILGDVVSQKFVLDQAQKDYKTTALSDTEDIVKKYNGILPKIATFYKQDTYFNEALSDILKIKTPDILYFSEISLTRDEKNGIKAVVSGRCSTRENLIIFKNNIEADKNIKDSYFSPESWIKEKDTNFSVTFNFFKNENPQ